VAELLASDALERLAARVRSLFVPTVSAVAISDLVGTENAADSLKQLFDWERDRLFTLSKGLGAAAIGVVTTLLVETAKGTNTTTLGDVLAAVFALLLLLWGAFILTGLRRLADEFPAALKLITDGPAP
jgi:Flp pilus assembly protein TadB